MFEQIFKNIDKILRTDDNCSTELDYVEQSSWLLFLKWLDDYDKEKKIKSELENKKYTPILKKEFQWSSWAVVKKDNGEIDYNKNISGQDLKFFVEDKLFPYLSSFKDDPKNIDTIEYKIGEIFSGIRNKLADGHTIRDVIDQVEKLKFQSNDEKHELSDLYEEKIKKMGNAGRNGGEYYTPRSLISSIVKAVNPKIGEIVYDGAVGSAGFLVETYNHIKNSKSLNSSELIKLEKKTLYGVEKKGLGYILGIMNMILHGIESPNIVRMNTLEINVQEIQNKDRVDVILANPPFGGGEKTQVQDNFSIRSSETAYLFLQHFIKKLKNGGRCGVIIKNTFLTNDDAIKLRQQLLTECNLHTILDLPRGVFQAGVQTVVLFFTKGSATKEILYHKPNIERNLGKTNPLNFKDLSNFDDVFITRKTDKNTWSKKINQIDKKTWDLGVKNPNQIKKIIKKEPNEIFNEIENLQNKSNQIFRDIKKLI